MSKPFLDMPKFPSDPTYTFGEALDRLGFKPVIPREGEAPLKIRPLRPFDRNSLKIYNPDEETASVPAPKPEP